MHLRIGEKTVNGKLLKWYPLSHQRLSPVVAKLRVHMLECGVCSDPRETICSQAAVLLVDADIALGLRKA